MAYNSKHSKYTEEQLREAIASSTSIRQALLKLDVAGKGGNYRVIHRAIEKFGISTEHFLGRAHNRGKTLPPKQDLSTYLSNQRPISSNNLRKRLLMEKVFQHECAVCKGTTWNSLPIPLELDHISGDPMDNSLGNLRLLCPNCHAQTPTYRGRNIGRKD